MSKREVWVQELDGEPLCVYVKGQQIAGDNVIRYVPESTGEWVSCGERMPEPGQWVLAHRPGHHMRMFSHTGWGWRKEDGTKPSHAREYTHWRPLPAPPQPNPESGAKGEGGGEQPTATDGASER